MIEIGKIIKAQGLKGELKVQYYADAENMSNLQYVIIGDNKKRYTVLSSIIRVGYCYITLDGVDDRTKAENFIGKEIFINKEDLSIEEDECIIDDLLGMKVILSSGDNYGEIINVEQYGSADILTISGQYGKWQVPYISELVESVDKQNKIMVLNEKRFEEVKVQ